MVRDVFPVAYSTLAPDALTQQVLSQYEIGSITGCYFWHRGLSDVYLVETEAAQYVLRVSHHHWRSRSDIEFELEYLDFLRSHHLPIAYPLPTVNGDLHVAIAAPEGERYASLFIYAPGEVAFGDLNAVQAYKLGETLGKVHQISGQFQSSVQRQPLTLDYLLDGALEDIAPFLQQRPHDVDFLQETICQLKQQLADFPKESPYWVVCWGDPHSGNAHFMPDNHVTLFDFDQCGHGWRAFEMAKFLEISLRTGTSRRIRDAFFEGYQNIDPLMEFEVNALQSFTQVAHFWVWSISLNFAKMHNFSRLDNSYFSLRIERLKRLKAPEWQLF